MKTCLKCKVAKEPIEFYKDKSRSDGYDNKCKTCDDQRIRPYEKEYHNNYNKNYYLNNRERYLLMGYVAQDKKRNFTTDITVEWMKENITVKSCIYCDDTKNLGCDRIDNDKGHTKDNVVPCCAICNTIRNRNFTLTEMLEIGKVIKKIKKDREQCLPQHKQ